MKNNSIVPDMIKFSAVIVAMPRWVLALLAADGFVVPSSWTWVHGLSAGFGALMTILEGVAIAYILGALVRTVGRQVAILSLLVVATCVTFGGVLTPSVYARVTGAEIKVVLPVWGIWVWSACVALSTIATVGAVGYAQAVVEGDATWRIVADQASAKVNQLSAELAQQDIQMRQAGEALAEHDRQAAGVVARYERQVVEMREQLSEAQRVAAEVAASGGEPNHCDRPSDVLHFDVKDRFFEFMRSGNGSRPTSMTEFVRRSDKPESTSRRWWKEWEEILDVSVEPVEQIR